MKGKRKLQIILKQGAYCRYQAYAPGSLLIPLFTVNLESSSAPKPCGIAAMDILGTLTIRVLRVVLFRFSGAEN